MNKLALIRIIAWSALAIVLICILVYGISGRPFLQIDLLNWGLGFRYDDYEDSGRYTIGAGSVPASEVSEIEIDWVDGAVNIITGSGDEITFSEQCGYSLNTQYTMRYYMDGGRLNIKYCESRASFRGAWGRLDKKLTLTVPTGITVKIIEVEGVSSNVTYGGIPSESLDIETVSGDIDVTNIISDSLEFESVSGNIETDNAQANTVKANSVSGNIKLMRGMLNESRCETVSGGIIVEPGDVAKSVKAETVSGTIRVRIPEDKGFSADYSSLSGSFSSDFAITVGNDRASYLDGDMKIDFSSVSGDFHVEKSAQ